MPDLDDLQRFLLLSLAVNYAVLLLWFVLFVFARGWMRRLHGRWFRFPDESFDALHYGGMAVYKVGILLFNLAPLVSLCLMARA
ncbi:MAG TPA: hypothetical protein PK743_02675 [Luteimonas sp.]|nr:hypothetical protein [Luteimonas sp.]HRO26393.1 hypothetical protein [Luteimonas sp.]HRP71524.1 hypothetical protein [Luteimonas sp.]